MAQVGRISGPLLQENLERNGVDLAFETNLLFLDLSSDPANPKVGIKNSSPSYELDVTGTISATDFRAGSLTIDDLFFNENEITTTVGDINVTPATPTDFINLNGNVEVNGNLHATGSITADGDLTLGDADTDSITLNADITSNIVPDVTNTYDLGATGKNWKDLFISNNITVGNNVVALQVATLNNLTVGADLAVTANAGIIGNLDVTGIITASEVTSSTDITLQAGTGAADRVEVTQSPFKVASFTTAQRDAKTSENGDIIYNTTTNKFQGYANSAWVDLH